MKAERYPVDEVARQLAGLALKLDDDREEIIRAASDQSGAPVEVVRKEFLHLQVFCIQTAIQSASEDDPRRLEELFMEYVNRAAANVAGGRFRPDQVDRTRRYEKAWVEFSEDDNQFVMLAAIAECCGTPDDGLPYIHVWTRNFRGAIEFTKYLRNIEWV